MHRYDAIIKTRTGVIRRQIAWHVPAVFNHQLWVPADDLPRPKIFFPHRGMLLYHRRHLIDHYLESLATDENALAGLTAVAVAVMRERLSWVRVEVVTEIIRLFRVLQQPLRARIGVVITVEQTVIPMVVHPPELLQSLVKQGKVVVASVDDHIIVLLFGSDAHEKFVVHTQLLQISEPCVPQRPVPSVFLVPVTAANSDEETHDCSANLDAPDEAPAQKNRWAE